MERELISCSSSSSTSNLRLPPGFRFHPSDEELIVHYLQSKATSRPLPAYVIAEIDLYKYNPWELPKKALFGEVEWYFFTPRDRKYPKGERPNRAAGLGYWKATGIDRPIFSSSGLSKPIGVKKGLAFYVGRPPKGEKTDWFMNEYRLLDASIKPPRHKGSMRLDDWVLCRVRYRGSVSKNTHETSGSHSTEKMMPPPKAKQNILTSPNCDMITDYLHKDCVLLAWLLGGGRAVPPGETTPSVNAEEIINYEKNLNSFCNNGFNNSQILFPTDNCFNLLNGETSEEKDAGCLDRKKQTEDNLSTETLAETDIYGYTENQSQYVANPMDSYVNFQELMNWELQVHTCNTEAALYQMT